ncbi:MAG TPA: hypothetical protein VG675_03895 [Bryobacteraceae bacterium]|nr:hypothetical protein [Bryobacteraceae bacterium]
MAKRTEPVYWEKISPVWWSSPAGYVMEEKGVWTAHVYRNLRNGNAWTEHKLGFRTAAGAKRWVEDQAEK